MDELEKSQHDSQEAAQENDPQGSERQEEDRAKAGNDDIVMKQEPEKGPAGDASAAPDK
eukprot:CAMPEP_0185567154 /NCGR_PEP_ID=MMETSP0434-20130131/517_1 /TAXON_ID=626734 ORGANISM="Favella taraikaensis, Strain Fe Narragansett Bay" /NCGR_SAMPLE_ID=MMETSP0434 /ASSEMBLY_ACC=CAM_ASM_000379 /LENGTH=58 /DNA_ID=CAMNT_0028181319 /DNA_START=102 /DNA_END=278 /DNA_ORIENTATION=+